MARLLKSVERNGKVTLKKKRTATITAKTADEKKTSAKFKADGKKKIKVAKLKITGKKR